MHEKSLLRQTLEAWRGRSFEAKDFGPAGFHIRKILGVACTVTVKHEKKGDKVFVNVTGIGPVMKGVGVPAPVNELLYLSLEPEDFDRAVFDKLSEGVREHIMKSPEYKALTTASTNTGGAEVQDLGDPGVPGDDLNQEIPF